MAQWDASCQTGIVRSLILKSDPNHAITTCWYNGSPGSYPGMKWYSPGARTDHQLMVGLSLGAVPEPFQDSTVIPGLGPPPNDGESQPQDHTETRWRFHCCPGARNINQWIVCPSPGTAQGPDLEPCALGCQETLCAAQLPIVF